MKKYNYFFKKVKGQLTKEQSVVLADIFGEFIEKQLPSGDTLIAIKYEVFKPVKIKKSEHIERKEIR